MYSKIITWDNLCLAFKKASVGRTYRSDILNFSFKLEENLSVIQKKLVNNCYNFGPYRQLIIKEPKRRIISIAPFADRIVHQVIYLVIEPVFDKLFIYDSYACRQKKGNHAAVRRLNAWLFNAQPAWAWQGDIYHYFASVNQSILLDQLACRISDQRVIGLLEKLIYSYSDQIVNGCQYGLPIGNLTSQLFANVYLNSFDHFIKRELRHKLYIRYMDDFIVLDQSKERLQKTRLRAVNFLKQQLDLSVHPHKSHIVKVKNGLTFLGYRHFYHYYRPKQETFIRIFKRFRQLSQNEDIQLSDFLDQYQGLLRGWQNYSKGSKCYLLDRRLSTIMTKTIDSFF